ncbi:MAG TPA: fused MFS/spermidine synthase [Casimicrobiaceae bacterium]|nr:fused MFS/spermidine synthase [Casimicrobiaceae bacterium]
MSPTRSPVLVVLAIAIMLVAAPAQAETIVHTERSLYRNIVVYDESGMRCMKFSRAVLAGRQSCQFLRDPQRLVFRYTQMMMAALYLDPEPHRILVLGLGGGTLPTALANLPSTTQVDVVEIDPAVTRVAQTYFGFKPGSKVHVFEEDGRVFVKRALRSGRQYDLVMLDAFDHEYIPEHLLTREFLAEVKGLLGQNGVLAANTFSNSRLYDHESATYQAVFGEFYNLRSDNRVILTRAGGLPPRDAIERNAAAVDSRLADIGVERDQLLSLFSTKRDWREDARVLTDQYSPSNLLNVQ